MGAIRGFFLVVVSVLLFLSFICINLFGILSLSLSYDNFQKESVSVIQGSLQSFNITNKIQEAYPMIQLYCQTNSNYIFNAGGYNFNIPCSIALQGTSVIIQEGAKEITRQVYYAKYDCNFLDCATSSQISLFLLSEKAYNFWTDKLRISLAVSFILLILLFLLVKKKPNMPLLSGILLVISSTPFVKLDILLNLFSNKLFDKFLRIFFSQSFYFSTRVLIVGIVLTIIGIVFKMFDVGFFISNLISKIKKPEKSKKQQNVQVGKKPAKTPAKKKSK